jgi:Domain of unknown function (DUF1707)
MIGPWKPVAAGARARGRLRASDADREQVIDTLKTAFVHGLLTKDEFGLRAGQALASRTYAELAAITAGITVPPPGAQPAKPARAPTRNLLTRKTVAWAACVLVSLPALGAAFLTYYGGFLVLFVFAFIGYTAAAKT